MNEANMPNMPVVSDKNEKPTKGKHKKGVINSSEATKIGIPSGKRLQTTKENQTTFMDKSTISMATSIVFCMFTGGY
jgi:hypothetical protein